MLHASKNTAVQRCQTVYQRDGVFMHAACIKDAWLFKQNIDHRKLEKRIEQSLIYHLWFPSRMTELTQESYTLKNEKQGLQFNITSNPSLSLQNKSDLEFALKLKNRQ